MQKYFFLLVIALSSLYAVNAQNSGLSFELHYPHFFVDENNNSSEVQGVFGGALQYQLTDEAKFNYGIEFRFDLNQTKKLYNGTTGSFENKLISHLNLFSKLNLDDLEKLKLYLDAGFTTYKYGGGKSPSFNGFNAGAGLSYDIIERIYIHGSFNYLKTFRSRKNVLSDSSPDTESQNIIRIGLGFKI